MNQFVNSIYLPHVHANIPLETVREVLETKFQIGTIGHMESIPKVNKKDGHLYYSCFVYFETWSNSPSANYLTYQINNNNQTKMYYTDKSKQYWIVCKNTSELQHTVNQQPKHISIVAQLPADVSVNTIASVIEAMDLGSVHSIQYCHDTVALTDEKSVGYKRIECGPYIETWARATEDSSDTIYTLSSLPVRSVYIHFDYWYRTQTACAFQDVMNKQMQVVVPVYDRSMIWTFYESKPITDGVNPYVWTKPFVL